MEKYTYGSGKAWKTRGIFFFYLVAALLHGYVTSGACHVLTSPLSSFWSNFDRSAHTGLCAAVRILDFMLLTANIFLALAF